MATDTSSAYVVVWLLKDIVEPYWSALLAGPGSSRLSRTDAFHSSAFKKVFRDRR
jgi:hypothetical protein